MNKIIFATLLMLAACGSRTEKAVVVGQPGPSGANGEQGPAGQPGANGLDGQDGTDGLNGQDGVDGQNGVDGVDGEQGPAGENGADGTAVNIVDYSGSGCQQVAAGVYVKLSSNTASLYTTSSCSSNSKFAEISQGEAYWATNTILVIWYNNGVRALEFAEVAND